MDLRGDLKKQSEEFKREKEQFKFYTQMLYLNNVSLIVLSDLNTTRNNSKQPVYKQ